MATLDDNLDTLALKRLLLLDILIKKKQMLAEYMKTGYFQLSKARYSLGCHAVSALRIPESSITATTRTSSHSELLEDTRVSYTAREVVAAASEEQVERVETDQDIEELSEKVSKTSVIDDEASSTLGIDNYEQDNEECKVANKKPINWFSALPPQSLRQAQSSFDASLQLAASCVSVQEQLMALDKQFNNFMEQKSQ